MVTTPLENLVIILDASEKENTTPLSDLAGRQIKALQRDSDSSLSFTICEHQPDRARLQFSSVDDDEDDNFDSFKLYLNCNEEQFKLIEAKVTQRVVSGQDQEEND